ncbi:DUF2974 domain-containing protein [Olsenella sp. AM30-3LB]|uniref:Mbeg1-like protein n=1 Tax=Olsenella sp. AM30-3LB TaxID=2292359 RepID=UPI000E4A10D2|nr:Mbeg1-like protein [Olsenella sp. AM30-3LB]RHD73377.1 DUF2974 domain-containing protein [Olsenella sp. AM30-3LB]
MELGENIQSYLRWRGDVPFSHAAVNHADALVLCKLAYFDLSRIAEAAEDQGITLAKCPSLVSDIHPKGPGDAGEGFFDEAASTARFGSVIARCYVDATPYDDDTQFSATEYVLPDGPVFVAFRGTDDTVLGWREDFELGYRRIPAQEKAERYLRDALARAATEGRHVIVGGHSKGANLAQYATSSLTDSELAAIDAIYLLDGPGICGDVQPIPPGAEWVKRVVRIIPTSSVMGRLFEPGVRPIVVRSSETGILQHELMTWQVADGGLATADAPDRESDWFASVFREWMDNVSLAGRQEFVDDLFDAIERAGSSTSEITSSLSDSLPTILAGIVGSRPGAKAAAAKLPLRALLGSVSDALGASPSFRWLFANGLAHCLELAAGGVLLIMLNRIAIPLALTLTMFCGVIALFVEMLARLRASGWNTRREGPRIFAFGVALVVFVLTLVKPDALYVYASLAFGIALGAAAWSYAQKAAARTRGGTSVAFNATMAVLLGLSAAFVLVAPQEMLAAYAVTLGITLLVCSVGSFLDWRHDVMERLGE